jgi:purine-binding chemotaxis protein CheW
MPISEEVVIVWLGGKPFAFPVTAVREVVQMIEPTPMPAWPDAALGIIDIRGELLPLVDVSEVLNRPALTISMSQFVLVLFASGR